jgi:hypothetical protein
MKIIERSWVCSPAQANLKKNIKKYFKKFKVSCYWLSGRVFEKETKRSWLHYSVRITSEVKSLTHKQLSKMH